MIFHLISFINPVLSSSFEYLITLEKKKKTLANLNSFQKTLTKTLPKPDVERSQWHENQTKLEKELDRPKQAIEDIKRILNSYNEREVGPHLMEAIVKGSPIKNMILDLLKLLKGHAPSSTIKLAGEYGRSAFIEIDSLKSCFLKENEKGGGLLAAYEEQETPEAIQQRKEEMDRKREELKKLEKERKKKNGFTLFESQVDTKGPQQTSSEEAMKILQKEREARAKREEEARERKQRQAELKKAKEQEEKRQKEEQEKLRKKSSGRI